MVVNTKCWMCDEGFRTIYLKRSQKMSKKTYAGIVAFFTVLPPQKYKTVNHSDMMAGDFL